MNLVYICFSFIYATMIIFPRGSTQHPSFMYIPYKVRGKQTNNPSTIGIGNQFPHGIFGEPMRCISTVDAVCYDAQI